MTDDRSIPRRMFLAGGVSAVGLGLAGCGGAAPARTARQGGEPTGTVRLLNPIFDGPDGKSLLEKLLAELKSRHPKMSVQVDYTDYSHLNEKLTTSVAGGAPYDVMMMGVGWIPPFASKGVLGPLDTTPAALAKTYNRRSVDPCVYGGKVYGLPVMLDTRFGIYRKDLFAAAGLHTPPASFQQMRDYARRLTLRDGSGKLTRAGIDLLSMDPRQVFEPLLWAAGGELFTPDLSRPAFNSAEGVAALQFMTDVIRTDKSEDYGFTKPGDVALPLAQGRAAMMIGHNNVWLNIQQNAPELIKDGKLGTFLVRDKRPAIFQGGTLATMSARSRHPAAAAALVEFLASPEVALAACRQRGNVPAATSALSSDYVKNDAFVKFALENMDSAFSEGGVPSWLDIRGDFKATIESALLGKKTPKQALDALAGSAAQAMKSQ